MSSAAVHKIRKSHRSNATQQELKVAQVIYDMCQKSNNLKAQLSGFSFNAVKDIEVSSSKNACVIFYPLRFLRKVRKVQKQLTPELEKKLGKQVLFVCQRKIQGKNVGAGVTVQRSRTMKAVHEAVLEDICFPADICGRRVRQLTDGSKHLKVYLETKDQDKTKNRIDTFVAAYAKLTGHGVAFGFMSDAALQQVVA